MTIQMIKVSLKTERIQCNATHAITGAIKRTFQNKLYSKSGFKSQKSRYWFRKHFLKKSWNTWRYLLTLFHKPVIYIIIDCLKMLQHFTTELMLSNIPFFHLHYENWTILLGKYCNLQLWSLSEIQDCFIKDWLTYSQTGLQYTWHNGLKLLDWGLGLAI